MTWHIYFDTCELWSQELPNSTSSEVRGTLGKVYAQYFLPHLAHLERLVQLEPRDPTGSRLRGFQELLVKNAISVSRSDPSVSETLIERAFAKKVSGDFKDTMILLSVIEFHSDSASRRIEPAVFVTQNDRDFRDPGFRSIAEEVGVRLLVVGPDNLESVVSVSIEFHQSIIEYLEKDGSRLIDEELRLTLVNEILRDMVSNPRHHYVSVPELLEEKLGSDQSTLFTQHVEQSFDVAYSYPISVQDPESNPNNQLEIGLRLGLRIYIKDVVARLYEVYGKAKVQVGEDGDVRSVSEVQLTEWRGPYG